jgi:glycosyltransferase involved in cell wall biosynthesis
MAGPEHSLTIGIDARAATEEVAGRGRVVRELLRAFAERDDPHRYRLYARTEWTENLDERFSWRLRPGNSAAWHVWSGRTITRECDVCLATNSYLTPLLTRVPTATIVYDLVVFDRGLRPPLRSALVERGALRLAAARSDALLAISQATAEALAQRLPRAAAKTRVVPLGVSPALSAGHVHPSVGEGFVLAVGTLEPRKNFPRLVEAFAALPAELQRAHPLVVVGRSGWGGGETMSALRSLGDGARILGAVSDAELAALYERCAVFCYPSLAEGFGLPVLEAMHAGAPVLTSDRSSLPEVGGDAVAYADPTSVEEIAGGLEALLSDPNARAELSRRGRERAAHFTWASSAGATLEALEAIALTSAR